MESNEDKFCNFTPRQADGWFVKNWNESAEIKTSAGEALL
jgi:hypothetical protein